MKKLFLSFSIVAFIFAPTQQVNAMAMAAPGGVEMVLIGDLYVNLFGPPAAITALASQVAYLGFNYAVGAYELILSYKFGKKAYYADAIDEASKAQKIKDRGNSVLLGFLGIISFVAGTVIFLDESTNNLSLKPISTDLAHAADINQSELTIYNQPSSQLALTAILNQSQQEAAAQGLSYIETDHLVAERIQQELPAEAVSAYTKLLVYGLAQTK